MQRTLDGLTAVIRREGDDWVALCPELDVASQGTSIEEARQNLAEAVELFLEAASESEVQARISGEVYITRLDLRRA